MSDAPKKSPITDTAGAAEYTALSASTLNKLRCSGGGPKYLKLGKIIRYRFADLDAWLESRTVNSTADAIRLI